MLLDVDGLAPNEEDTWLGRRVAVGEAVVRIHGLVGAAPSLEEPGHRRPDLDTLRTLRGYRGDRG